MTTTATKVPYADASPAELREAILPEDVPEFDQQYREALRVAAETYRLDELEATLRSWRLRAWNANAYGHDHWRKVLRQAEETLRTGQPPAGMPTYSAQEMRERFRARQAQA